MKSNLEVLGHALGMGLLVGVIVFIRYLFLRFTGKKEVKPCFDDPVLLRERMKDQRGRQGGDDEVASVCADEPLPLPDEDAATKEVALERIEERRSVCRRSFPWLRCGVGVCVLGVFVSVCYLFDFLDRPKCIVVNNLEGDSIVLNMRDVSCVDFRKDDEDTAIKDESEECSVMLANGRRIDVDKSTARKVFLGICENEKEANARFAEEDRRKVAQKEFIREEAIFYVNKMKYSDKEVMDAIFCGDLRNIPHFVKAGMELNSGERYVSDRSIRHILAKWALSEGGYSEEEVVDDYELVKMFADRLRKEGVNISLRHREEDIYLYISGMRKEGKRCYLLEKANRE